MLKVLCLLKYAKTSLNTFEKQIFKGVKSTKMDLKDLNNLFGLRERDTLIYVENASELSRLLRSNFGEQYQVRTIKSNYVHIYERDSDDRAVLDFEPKREFTERTGDVDYNLEDNIHFNIEVKPGDTEIEIQEVRKKAYLSLHNYRIDKLDNMITNARNDNRFKTVQFLTKVKENLTSRESLSLLKNFKDITGLVELAERDLTEISNMLDGTKIGYEHVVYARKVLSNWEKVFDLYFTEDDVLRANSLVEVMNKV